MYKYKSIQKKETKTLAEKNQTNIPDAILQRAEKKAGMSLGHLRAHLNSSIPAQYGAEAITQGNSMYFSTGAEKHMGHEIGHAVQQLKGLVRPTGTVNGQPVNDDERLEREADRFL